MPKSKDADAFRRWASRAYRAAMALLLVLAFACGGLGYHIAGIWGAAIGLFVGFVLAAGGAIGLTLLIAMSQDGA